MNAALQLLITLVGVTLLFGCAEANGTTDRLIRKALRLCRGRVRLLPPMFFAIAAVAAMVGPGAILSTAFVAPFAMNAGIRAGLAPFLIALMVCNGANAGNLSPFSTVGAIASALMTQAGLGGHEFRVWFFHGAAHVLVASAAYFVLVRRASTDGSIDVAPIGTESLSGKQIFTVGVTAVWIATVIVLRVPLGWSALAAAIILLLTRTSELRPAVARMPWKVIALVVCISTAIGFAEKAGGLEWLKDTVAAVSGPRSVHAVLAFITGVISAYSSTSGVVLPAFLPLASSIAARVPGTDPLALSITTVVGSALVDVSPLSTLGALCVAATPPEHGPGALFRKLLIWGLSMTVVGALFCYVMAPFFAAA